MKQAQIGKLAETRRIWVQGLSIIYGELVSILEIALVGCSGNGMFDDRPPLFM